MTPPRTSLQRFWSEVKRRRVDRVVVTYAAAAFVLLQAADLVLPALPAPGWAYRALVIVVLAGFPITVALSWFFDLTGEGVQRTAAAAEVDRERAVAPERRTFTARYSLAIAVLLVLGGAVWWLRPAILSGKVAAGADVVAVVPFRATGTEEVRVLGEGMVDLLSTNLDEVGAMRTVDPRRVLRAWERLQETGGVDDAEALLALGRDLEAGSVLSGSVVGTGSQVRIEGELRTVDGEELGSARVDGPADQVLSLVDSLSLRLLREVWRSRDPLPELRVSGITTSSLDAIRAFLEGEAHYRRSEWDRAAEDFRRAVEADSTFALAYYRLSSAYGWGEALESPRGQEALRNAGRFGDRLPARERLLVHADSLWKAGDFLGARDTLTAFVARHPEDTEALYLLADVLYHGRGTLALPEEQVREAFERVLEKDPAFAPALIHPLDMALQDADSARFFDHLQRFRGMAGEEQTRLYDLFGKALWTHPDSAAAAARYVAEQRFTALGNLLFAAFRTGGDPRVVLEVVEESGALPPPGTGAWSQHTIQRAFLYGALGEFRRMRELTDSLAAADVPGGSVRGVLLFPVLAGAASPDVLGDLAADVMDPSASALDAQAVQAFVAYQRGDTAALVGALDRVRGLTAGREDTTGRAAELVGDLEARVALERGDTAAALDLLEPLLTERMEADGNDQLRFLLGLAELARIPSTREAALERLEDLGLTLPHLVVQRERLLGEAYEAAGDTAAALRHHRRFVELAGRAEGLMARQAEESRAAVRRLEGAPSS